MAISHTSDKDIIGRGPYDPRDQEPKQQHEKIKGYRTLSQQEIDLMNEGKELAEKVGAWIKKLRSYPATPFDGVPTFDELPSLDQRSVSIGATELQTGFMWAIRGIAQPSTF